MTSSGLLDDQTIGLNLTPLIETIVIETLDQETPKSNGQSSLVTVTQPEVGYLPGTMWEKMFTSCVGETVLEISCQDRNSNSGDQETTISSTEVAMLSNDRCGSADTKTLNTTQYRKKPRHAW